MRCNNDSSEKCNYMVARRFGDEKNFPERYRGRILSNTASKAVYHIIKRSVFLVVLQSIPQFRKLILSVCHTQQQFYIRFYSAKFCTKSVPNALCRRGTSIEILHRSTRHNGFETQLLYWIFMKNL